LSAARLCPPAASRRRGLRVQPNYYVVRDANRQQLAYVYFERSAAKLLTKDEARWIAATKVSLAKDGEARF
jgi:hypothetical protein